MQLEEIEQQIRACDHISDDGSLSVFSSKRPFAWKDDTVDLVFELAWPFIFYFEDSEKQPDLLEEAMDGAAKFEQHVRPHLNVAKAAFRVLTEFAEHARSQRVKKKLAKMMADLDGLEPILQRKLAERFLEFESDIAVEMADGFGVLSPVGAKDRLMIVLYDRLSTYTNLTKDNILQHIAHLLHGFEIADYNGGVERAQQAIFGRGRKQRDVVLKSIQTRLEWRRMIHEQMVSTGDTRGEKAPKKI